MSKPRLKKVLIAAGGTGGHIIPALALAEEMRFYYPDIALQFVCGSRPAEARLYRQAHFSPIVLRVKPIAGNVFEKLARLCILLLGVVRSWRIMREQQPGLVLCMGGYVAAPIVFAALMRGVPVVLHEQNSIPGRLNGLVAPLASSVICAFDEAGRRLKSRKCQMLGIPVRRALLDATREEGIEFFGLKPDVPVVLLLGGSQGAKYFNIHFAQSLGELDGLLQQPLQVLWSAGEKNYAEIQRRVEGTQLKQITVHLFPYIERMDYAYAAASLVVGRAGASTLAEITARGVPSLLIPFPYATGDHQRHNAMALEERGAAEVLDEKYLTKTTLAQAIVRLLSNPQELAEMARRSAELGKPEARKEIARLLASKLMNHSNRACGKRDSSLRSE
jgi:UDP-N-acetylglucosamine--N-acetylmuramyl-(pentapeptide) pyrophosphoryl-undecaprenol N-acetylglucosamine transferase